MPELASHRGIFEAGEVAAKRKLRSFLDRRRQSTIYSYAGIRNRMDLEGTSALSPYLRLGMLSARQVYLAAREAGAKAKDRNEKESVETWLSEIVWREFYIAVLYHFPKVVKQSYRADLRGIRWRNNEKEFQAWCEGQTGYPVVDAAMRQLNSTGWMHNRARMIVASFLSKHLLIDWRWGERVFMQRLVDGDPAANNGGWQWSSGTGTDAAPYFRVFNPRLQGERFDPAGAYVRRFVPELEGVPTKYIHCPQEMAPLLQASSGCRIGKDYPAPIVSHMLGRTRALAAFSQAKTN